LLIGNTFVCVKVNKVYQITKRNNQKLSQTTMEAKIEITKESGEVIETIPFATELGAQTAFDELEKIRWPQTYKGHVMNLSEYPEGRIGIVRLIAVNKLGEFERRELFRKP
jgi:hypothetical protein